MTAGHSIHLKGHTFLVFPKPLGVIVYNLFTSRQLCLCLTWVFSGKTLFQNHCYTKEISPWQPEGAQTVIGTTKKKKKKKTPFCQNPTTPLNPWPLSFIVVCDQIPFGYRIFYENKLSQRFLVDLTEIKTQLLCLEMVVNIKPASSSQEISIICNLKN